MAFNHIQWTTKFLEHWNVTKLPFNDTSSMISPVVIKPVTAPAGTKVWRIIGIHHLIPDENRSNRNAYLALLKEDNSRQLPAFVGWTWEGIKFWEKANPVMLDKPNYEPPGNISLGKDQKVSCWSLGNTAQPGALSDQAANIHTIHPDERAPGGELWNSIGHHSFYIVWKWDLVAGSVVIQPPPVDPPIDPPPVDPETKIYQLNWVSPDNKVRIKGTVEVDY